MLKHCQRITINCFVVQNSCSFFKSPLLLIPCDRAEFLSRMDAHDPAVPKSAFFSLFSWRNQLSRRQEPAPAVTAEKEDKRPNTRRRPRFSRFLLSSPIGQSAVSQTRSTLRLRAVRVQRRCADVAEGGWERFEWQRRRASRSVRVSQIRFSLAGARLRSLISTSVPLNRIVCASSVKHGDVAPIAAARFTRDHPVTLQPQQPQQQLAQLVQLPLSSGAPVHSFSHRAQPRCRRH